MQNKQININANELINPLLAGIIVNSWYNAQSIHLAEKGTLSAEEKAALLVDVVLWQGKIRKLLEESKDILSLSENEMLERLRKIF